MNNFDLEDYKKTMEIAKLQNDIFKLKNENEILLERISTLENRVYNFFVMVRQEYEGLI